jgi:hypothetical protein
VEHNAVLPCGDGQQVSETCTLATTLLEHTAASAEQIREAYLRPPPDILAAQRRERARIRSQRQQRWGRPRPELKAA